MTSLSFPDYVKIGYAEDPKQRLKDGNNTTWTPFGFRLYGTFEVSKNKADTCLHRILDSANANLRAVDTIEGKARKREFFKMKAEDAFSILKEIAYMTDSEKRLWRNNKWSNQEIAEDQETINKKEKITKRKNFRFEDVNLKKGDIISFKYDESKKAIVLGTNKVEYNGKNYSISGLALKLINQIPGHHWKSAHGAGCFMYDDQLIADAWESGSKFHSENSISKVQSNRGNDLSKYGLKDGDKIEFIRKSGLDLTVKNNRIVYKGKDYSLSGLAKILLNEYCNINWRTVAGPQYFTYKGKPINDYIKD